MKLTIQHKSIFLSFFNKQGYVLDFSDDSFEKFCLNIINVSPKKIYKLSKGKSLERYVEEEKDENKIKKLFKELLIHYELSSQMDLEMNSENYYDREHYNLYLKVKKYEYLLDENVNMVTVNSFSKDINSDYIDSQIKIMNETQNTNPTEAIGKAKELLESVCKTILNKLKIQYNDSLEVPQLVKITCNALNLSPENIDNEIQLTQILKQILGALASITNGLAALRNSYGSGHGKIAQFKSLEVRHAKLAVGSACVLINFLWDCYIKQSNQ